MRHSNVHSPYPSCTCQGKTFRHQSSSTLSIPLGKRGPICPTSRYFPRHRTVPPPLKSPDTKHVCTCPSRYQFESLPRWRWYRSPYEVRRPKDLSLLPLVWVLPIWFFFSGGTSSDISLQSIVSSKITDSRHLLIWSYNLAIGQVVENHWTRHGKVQNVDWWTRDPINESLGSISFTRQRVLEQSTSWRHQLKVQRNRPLDTCYPSKCSRKRVTPWITIRHPHNPPRWRERKRRTKRTKKEDQAGTPRRYFKTSLFPIPKESETVYSKIKCQTEEIELACEEDYSLKNSDFALKRREKKLTLKLHHKSRPLTPRRIRILERLKRENNMSSISSS